MNKFTHIGSFHQVAKYITELNSSFSVPPQKKIKNPVEFIGTVKLHGTNAGIAFIGDEIKFQSRNRRITSQNDNAGFAAFGESRVKALADFRDEIRDVFSVKDFTIFGEWCGPGIQKSVAIGKLPERQFVMFAIAAHGEDDELTYSNFKLLTEHLDYSSEDWKDLNDLSIYSIHQIPSYEITVDFSDELSYRKAAETIEKLTLEVEESCPWAKKFGIDGIGEGLVWVPVSEGTLGNTDLFFKSKGRRHQDKAAKNLVPVDFEKIATVQAFIEFILTERRLEQGVEYLQEHNLELSRKSTGAFLKWINEDCEREGADTLQENNLKWDDVVKGVSTTARIWFFDKLDKGEI